MRSAVERSLASTRFTRAERVLAVGAEMPVEYQKQGAIRVSWFSTASER